MSKPIVAVLTPEAREFLRALEKETRQEFGASIRQLQNGERVHNFKKLVNTDDIFEFSVVAPRHTYRLFAFWDTRGATATLIVCTHGLDKKTQKTPPQEIRRAEELKKKHFATPPA